MVTAYCWSSGLIEFTRRKAIPDGALAIASAPAKKLRPVVIALARHGYGASAGKLLVPGIPGAELIKCDPVEALITFTTEVEIRLGLRPRPKRRRMPRRPFC